MKRALIVIVALFLVFTVTGCSLNRRVGERAAEKAAENFLGKVLGGGDAKVDIDLKEEKFVIKDDKGGSFSIGQGEWPKTDYLPQLEGNIISTTNDSSGNVIVMLEGVKQKDLDNYLKKVKGEFSKDYSESTGELYYAYHGKNSAGNGISVQVYNEDNSVIVMGFREGS
jgi:hypothetical protein